MILKKEIIEGKEIQNVEEKLTTNIQKAKK